MPWTGVPLGSCAGAGAEVDPGAVLPGTGAAGAAVAAGAGGWPKTVRIAGTCPGAMRLPDVSRVIAIHARRAIATAPPNKAAVMAR